MKKANISIEHPKECKWTKWIIQVKYLLIIVNKYLGQVEGMMLPNMGNQLMDPQVIQALMYQMSQTMESSIVETAIIKKKKK